MLPKTPFIKICNEFSEEQCEILERIGIKNPILIKSGLKLKQLHPLNTYIKFENEVLPLTRVFGASIENQNTSKDFYYIYADVNSSFDARKLSNIMEDLWKTTN